MRRKSQVAPRIQVNMGAPLGTLWTPPVQFDEDARAERVISMRAEEEMRLISVAGTAPLKIRWRRSWSPLRLEQLACLYAGVPLNTLGLFEEADRAVVNFLRHERTAYDALIHRRTGLQCGTYGTYDSVYLLVKRRVHEHIAKSFPWLAGEAERQLDLVA